jgi:retron-type reverse transcriptase
VVAKADDLFERIASFRALHEAAERAIRGKRRKPGGAAFMANRERELLRLEAELQAGTWRPGRYTVIEIRDPKPRRVSAAPFRDRVVHHALCAVIEPVWEKRFIFDSYANRIGKGSHWAVARYEHFRDRHAHVLRGDLYRYFPSIDHAILKTDLRRRIACKQTLWLLDTIIDGSNAQEPVNLYFPCDDIFTPFERRRGLPIGNLTSQFFANVFLDGFDHYIKEVLRAPYLRYVDDWALFHDDPAVLADWRIAIERYLQAHRLVVHPRKTWIASTLEAATFLGYVLLPGGGRRLPEDNVSRFRNRLRSLRDRWQAGSVEENEVRQRITSWIAHANQADTRSLRHALFAGGWFDPFRSAFPKPDDLPGGRVLRGGSWNNKPENLRAATRNRNDAANRNNNIGFRLASTSPHAGAATFTEAAGVYGRVHRSS